MHTDEQLLATARLATDRATSSLSRAIINLDDYLLENAARALEAGDIADAMRQLAAYRRELRETLTREARELYETART